MSKRLRQNINDTIFTVGSADLNLKNTTVSIRIIRTAFLNSKSLKLLLCFYSSENKKRILRSFSFDGERPKFGNEFSTENSFKCK